MARSLILVLAGSTILVAADQAGGDKAVALRPLPALPWDGQALTPSSVKKTEGRRDLPGKAMIIARKSGLVEPADHTVINKEASITVGGTQVTFTQQSGSVSYAMTGGRPTKLKNRGDGMEGIAVPTANKTIIPLVIPRAEVQTNNQATTVRLYYRSGLVMGGLLGSDPLWLMDDEIDGVLTSGKDAISVNSGIVFATLGKWLPTSTGLFQVTEADKGWAKLTCAPAGEATVPLSIAATGLPGETHAVYMSKDVQAVVTSRKPVVTKAGSYKLAYAMVIDPAKKVVFAGILPGKSKEADAAAPMALGGPFKLEFTATAVNKLLAIDPNTIRLYGRNDEQYVHFRITGQPGVGLNGKPFGMMPMDNNRGTPNEFSQQVPNRIPAGEATVTLDLVVDGLGKLQGTAKVTL